MSTPSTHMSPRLILMVSSDMELSYELVPFYAESIDFVLFILSKNLAEKSWLNFI